MYVFSGVTNFLAFTSIIFTIVRVIYLCVIRYWNYFSYRNVTFERGLPMVGTILGHDFRTMLGRKATLQSVMELYDKHSDKKFFGMYEIGGKPSYFIRDLDLIRDISIKDFDYFPYRLFRMNLKVEPLLGRALVSLGDQPWQEMRSTLSPLFTGSKMRQMLTLMTECVTNFNACIRKDIKSNSKTNSKEYDISSLLMLLTNDIIGSTAFGIQINSLEDPQNEFYKMGKEVAYSLLSVRALFAIYFPKIASLLHLKILTNKHDAFFRNLIHHTLEQRQKDKIVRNDMLNLLMLAKEGRINEVKDTENDQDTGFATVSEFLAAKTTKKLKNWTEDDLVAQSVVFFIAGFTALSRTFDFLCYELSLNPEIQELLYKEIKETKEQSNGEPLTFEALQKMKYMDMVVSEQLRKWPVGALGDRVVGNKQYLVTQSDGSKVLFEPGTPIWIPTFAIHRDPKYYPNPNEFDPERFSDANKKNLHPHAYMPFGNGPRNCIASRFALLQIKAVMFHILSDFKMECSPKTPIPMKLKGGTNFPDSETGFYNRLVLRE